MGQAQYQQRRQRQQQQQRRAYNNLASVTNHLLTVFENYSKNLIFEIFLDYLLITIYGLCFSVKIQIK